MQRGYKLLISGTAILVVGIILIVITFVILQPGLAKILDVNFTQRLFTNFTPTKDGKDNVIFTNLGSKEVSANTVFGSTEFFDTGGQPQTALSATAIAGPLLSFIGIVVLIIGGIFLLIDRSRRKRRNNKYQE